MPLVYGGVETHTKHNWDTGNWDTKKGFTLYLGEKLVILPNSDKQKMGVGTNRDSIETSRDNSQNYVEGQERASIFTRGDSRTQRSE